LDSNERFTHDSNLLKSLENKRYAIMVGNINNNNTTLYSGKFPNTEMTTEADDLDVGQTQYCGEILDIARIFTVLK
jgi:hypothetical protein